MRAVDFWDETPREFYFRLEGHREKQEFKRREHLESLRISTTIIANSFREKYVPAEKFWPLPWDQEKPTIDIEKVREVVATWKLPKKKK